MEASTTHHPIDQEHHGWFVLAGILFIVSGAANLLWGIGALNTKSYLSESGLLFSTMTFWGWVSVIWGVAALIGSAMLLGRTSMAMPYGVTMATLSAIFWLFSLPVLPIFSLIIIAVDVMIIYGLISQAEATDR
jgi:hypothetical protein